MALFKKKQNFLKDYSFYIVLIVALVLSFVLIAPLSVGFNKIERGRVGQVIADAEEGIQMEADYLLSQARELDDNRTFDRYLLSSDSAGLISLSTEEARKRGIGGILITNASGQVLSRVHAIGQRGDFISHSTFWGKETFEKGQSSGIDRGAAHPIIIFGTKRIDREGQVLGLIVAAQILDDDYAEIFADKYLPADTKVAFFSKEEGLIGSNFESLEEKRLLETYFSPNSGFNERDSVELRTSFNGGDYLAKNLVFESGYDGPIGNMIVFVPQDYDREVLFLSLIITVFFILSSIVVVYFDKHKHNPVPLSVIISLGVVAVFSLSYLYSKEAFRKEYQSFFSPPYLIYNSVLNISPDSETIGINFEHLISVNILSGGESINAVEAEIRYDPAFIMVQEIITTNSFCSQDLFVEREIDNDNGLVRVVCGLPSPGFNELKGTVFELAVRPLRTGQTSFWFGDNTAVLANDGLGTNVLRDNTGASYLVVDGETLEEANASEPLLFSPTHPNLTRWYNHRTTFFTWWSSEAYRYKYILSKDKDVVPEGDFEETDSTANFEVDEDGLYYFRLLAEDAEGTISRLEYPIKIDSTPPDAPSIKASSFEAVVGEVVRFEFSSNDELSGLQNGFYVKLRENGVFFPSGSQLYVAFPEKGEHKVTVRAFDRANNYSQSSQIINVK